MIRDLVSDRKYSGRGSLSRNIIKASKKIEIRYRRERSCSNLTSHLRALYARKLDPSKLSMYLVLTFRSNTRASFHCTATSAIFLLLLLPLLSLNLDPNASTSWVEALPRQALPRRPFLASITTTLIQSPSSAPGSSPARYDSYASDYDTLDSSSVTKALGIDTGRANLLSRIKPQSSVLEVGAGTGINYAFYPTNVRKLVMLDLSSRMLDVARAKVPASTITSISYSVADVTNTKAMEGALNSEMFDYVVDTFTLCVLGEDGAVEALKNMRSRVKPNGEVLLFENSRSSNALLGSYQDLTAGMAAENGGKGCVYNQRVEEIIARAGMDVVKTESFAGGTFRSFVCVPKVQQ